MFTQRIITLGAAISLCILALTGHNTAQSNQPLVQFSDLHYLGAFKLPDTWSGSDYSTFRYANGPVAFNPHSTTNPNVPSLFIACFRGTGNVSEVNIPSPVISTDFNKMNTATIIQGCKDISQGATQLASSKEIGGLLVSGTKMYFTFFQFYPAAGCDAVSHFVKNSLNLSAGDATGGFAVNADQGLCFVNGPMTWVPPEWQALFGNKPAITYNCCHSIIGSTSWGPAAFAFNPSTLGSTPTSSVALQWYSSNHHTLGNWSGNGTPLVFASPWNNSWNNAPSMGYRGLVIPNGTRSALYFGAQGIGAYCYGCGTNINPTPATVACPDVQVEACYDPVAVGGKGDHAYPYRIQIMAFDLNNWTAVAAGQKNPYDVVPYAVWPLVSPAIPFADGLGNQNCGGAAYDPATRRIYWEHSIINGPGLPIIEVWEVASATSAISDNPAQLSPDMVSVYPNPFNPAVSISVALYGYANLRLLVYDISGRCVADLTPFLVNGKTIWDASGRPSGIYIIQARIGNGVLTKRIMLAK